MTRIPLFSKMLIMVQLNLDFNPHREENNYQSRKHLEENRDKFSAQCAKVYDLLLSGVRLTTFNAISEYGIGDIRRRIKDLRDINGKTDIQDRWVRDGKSTRYKEWWI